MKQSSTTILYGQEPIIKNINMKDEEDLIWNILKANEWYKNTCTPKDFIKFVTEYMKKNKYTKQNIKCASKAKSLKTVFKDIAYLCRISTNGCTLPKIKADLIKEKIKELMDKGCAKAQNSKVLPSVKERLSEKVSDFICEIENNIDQYGIFLCDNKKGRKVDIAAWSTGKQLKPAHAKMIKDFFEHVVEENEMALTGSDPDLKEGYSWLSKPNLRKYCDYTKGILDHMDTIIATNGRKPRKKKKKTPEQQVQKLKFQEEDIELNIKSIDPRLIVGAKVLVVFNTKYKKVSIYYSNDNDGFSIKGTTVQNWDEKKSFTKTLRKPKSVVQSLKGNQKNVETKLESLKTKSSSVNGRLNDNTILIQTIK